MKGFDQEILVFFHPAKETKRFEGELLRLAFDLSFAAADCQIRCWRAGFDNPA